MGNVCTAFTYTRSLIKYHTFDSCTLTDTCMNKKIKLLYHAVLEGKSLFQSDLRINSYNSYLIII